MAGIGRRTAGVGAAALVVATVAAAATAGGTTGAAGAERSAFTRPAASDGALARAALRAVATHPAAVRSGAAQEFEVTGALVDPDGTSHVRLVRTYRGLPVLGGDLVVHQGEQGTWQGRSQTLARDLTLGVVPGVSRPVARRAALAPSDVTGSITGERVSAARLVVDATGARPRLAYEVLSGGTQEDGTPSRLASYVDARTGRVLRTEQQIQDVDGTGRSLYGGTVPLRLTLSGSTYQLKDPTRGGTYTTDLANREDSFACQMYGSDCRIGTLFTSSDTSFGSGSTSSRESAAVDAQYGTDQTWDYFKTVHGRNGIF